jgi:predicted ester cyclase
MTPDAILREWFEKVWNEGDEKTIMRLAHPEAVVHGLSDNGEPVRGTAQFVQFFHAFRGAIPDIHVTVQRTVSEGAYTTGHCVVTGRHTGPGLQIAATNKPIRFEGVCILRIANGVIVEAWNFFDFLSFYTQLGVVELPA